MAVIEIFYLLFIDVRIKQWGVLWFVHLGKHFLESTHSSIVGVNLHSQSAFGYDGQYYYALAADPVHAHTYLGVNTGYVYSRPFYPLLSRVVSGGSLSALPYGMLAVNLFAVAGGTFAVALWLKSRNVSPWFALLYGLWPGLIFCTFRDLTEPLAFGLTAVGFVVFDPTRPKRIVGAMVLFALALLTRETVFPFPVAAAAMLVLADRSTNELAKRRGLTRRLSAGGLMLAGCGLPLLAWRFAMGLWLHHPTQEQGSGTGWAIPFHGLSAYWRFDRQHWLILATVVVPALLVSATALAKGLWRRDIVVVSLLIANALAFVVFLPQPVDVDFGAASRAAIGVALAAIYCVPGFKAAGARRSTLVIGAFSLSLGWYLIAAATLRLPTIPLITS